MSEWDIQDEQPAPALRPKYQRIDRRLARELKREAKYYASLIPDVLADVGYDHWKRKEARPDAIDRIFYGETSRQKVQIMHVAYNEAAIYLRVDPLRLPYRVTVPMLKDEDVLETLSVACGRKVTFQLRDYANGCWLVIARDGVISSIPTNFSFKEAINHVPKTGSVLRYCAGVTENMRLIIPDLEQMPHLLIAGATGYGKSVHLNAIICQFMWRNSPDAIKFLMLDLKGGMELQDYKDSPFLWRDIVTDIEEVVPALQDFKTEMFRRQKVMAGAARSLPQYNRLRKEKLPYIILIVDELAQVLRHPRTDLSNEATLELGAILNVSRATGGHTILCTQRPSVDVISGYLKTNLPSRMAFRTPTDADSRVILDTSHAADIDIAGRAWMLHKANRFQIQTPWISPTMIRRTIKAINEREQQPQREEIDMLQVARLSLDQFGGSLARRNLYKELKDRIGKNALEDMLSAFDNEVIDIDGVAYEIVPGNGGGIPRSLQRVETVSVGDNGRQ